MENGGVQILENGALILTGDGDDHLQVRSDNDVLAAPSSGLIVFGGNPPPITILDSPGIVEVGTNAQFRRCRFFDPFFWNDLLTAPDSLIEVKKAKLGHVPWFQKEFRTSQIDPFVILAPLDFGNPQRFE